MIFKQNAQVVSAEGETLAKVDRVVVDPRTHEITHIIVREGLLLTEDKVVPVHLVEAASEDEVRLSGAAGNLESLPHYEETYFVEPGDDNRSSPTQHVMAPMVYASPPARGAILHEMESYPGAGTTLQSEKTVPEGTVELEKGTRVVTQDGEEVGSVDEVLVDARARQMTHFVISRGVFSADKCVPADWVAEMTEDAVRLAVSKQVLDRLPDYEK
jgi:uncharacterized protein YrrD